MIFNSKTPSKLNDKTHWNGRELTGIGTIQNNANTRRAWRNLVLSIYKQAVFDDEGVNRVGVKNIKNLYNLSLEEYNMIDDFINFKTEISEFYLDFILAYNSLNDTESTREKLF